MDMTMQQVLEKCSKRVMSDISKLKRKGLGRESRNLDPDNIRNLLESFNEKILDLGPLIEECLSNPRMTRLLLLEVENKLTGFPFSIGHESRFFVQLGGYYVFRILAELAPRAYLRERHSQATAAKKPQKRIPKRRKGRLHKFRPKTD